MQMLEFLPVSPGFLTSFGRMLRVVRTGVPETQKAANQLIGSAVLLKLCHSGTIYDSLRMQENCSWKPLVLQLH